MVVVKWQEKGLKERKGYEKEEILDFYSRKARQAGTGDQGDWDRILSDLLQCEFAGLRCFLVGLFFGVFFGGGGIWSCLGFFYSSFCSEISSYAFDVCAA